MLTPRPPWIQRGNIHAMRPDCAMHMSPRVSVQCSIAAHRHVPCVWKCIRYGRKVDTLQTPREVR